MKAVVVTGVSSGIGYATARVLIAAGMRVYGTVRQKEDGDRLRSELGPDFLPLRLDVKDDSSIRDAAQQVAQQLDGQTLFGLVNNAGVAFPCPVLTQTRAEFATHLEVNLIGVFAVTQAFLPLLGVDRNRKGVPGRIINISSVGGKIAAPFISAYAASKHGLEGFSESLRRELLPFGIDVIIVAPGSVATPIFAKSETSALLPAVPPVYAESLAAFVEYTRALARAGIAPERVGEAIVKALTARWPAVRYAVVPNSLFNWTIPRALPRRVVNRAMGQQMRLTRRSTLTPAAPPPTGRVCVITGATGGIGEAAALALARRGDTVAIVGRDESRALRAREAIIRQTGNPALQVFVADLSLMRDVRRLAQELSQVFPQIDVLINNASALYRERAVTPEGIEQTLAVNHLAGFELTRELLPRLQAAPAGRVVNVSADPRILARLAFTLDDLESTRNYSGINAYMATKLMNVLFTYELARRLEGTRVTTNAMHPGLVRTGLDRDIVGPMRWLFRLGRPFARSPEQGARTAVFLATEPKLDGISSRFFIDERETRSSPVTYDVELAKGLWSASEALGERARTFGARGFP